MLGIAIIAIGAAVVAAWPVLPQDGGARWLRESGPFGAFALAVAYLIIAVAALPIAGVTLIAGGTYGLGGGLAMVVPVELLGALCAFGLGRRYLRGHVARRWGNDHRFSAIDRAIGGADGFRIATLLRMAPIVPFGAANYVLATTSMRAGTYTAATLVGTLPGTVMYLCVGAMAEEGIQGGVEVQLMWWGGLAVSLLALAAATWATRAALLRAAHDDETRADAHVGGGL